MGKLREFGSGSGGAGVVYPDSADRPFNNNSARNTWANNNRSDLIKDTTVVNVDGTQWYLWTGASNPDTVDSSLWMDAAQIVQGPQGEKGDAGGGLVKVNKVGDQPVEVEFLEFGENIALDITGQGQDGKAEINVVPLIEQVLSTGAFGDFNADAWNDATNIRFRIRGTRLQLLNTPITEYDHDTDVTVVFLLTGTNVVEDREGTLYRTTTVIVEGSGRIEQYIKSGIVGAEFNDSVWQPTTGLIVSKKLPDNTTQLVPSGFMRLGGGLKTLFDGQTTILSSLSPFSEIIEIFDDTTVSSPEENRTYVFSTPDTQDSKDFWLNVDAVNVVEGYTLTIFNSNDSFSQLVLYVGENRTRAGTIAAGTCIIVKRLAGNNSYTFYKSAGTVFNGLAEVFNDLSLNTWADLPTNTYIGETGTFAGFGDDVDGKSGSIFAEVFNTSISGDSSPKVIHKITVQSTDTSINGRIYQRVSNDKDAILNAELKQIGSGSGGGSVNVDGTVTDSIVTGNGLDSKQDNDDVILEVDGTKEQVVFDNSLSTAFDVDNTMVGKIIDLTKSTDAATIAAVLNVADHSTFKDGSILRIVADDRYRAAHNYYQVGYSNSVGQPFNVYPSNAVTLTRTSDGWDVAEDGTFTNVVLTSPTQALFSSPIDENAIPVVGFAVVERDGVELVDNDQGQKLLKFDVGTPSTGVITSSTPLEVERTGGGRHNAVAVTDAGKMTFGSPSSEISELELTTSQKRISVDRRNDDDSAQVFDQLAYMSDFNVPDPTWLEIDLNQASGQRFFLTGTNASTGEEEDATEHDEAYISYDSGGTLYTYPVELSYVREKGTAVFVNQTFEYSNGRFSVVISEEATKKLHFTVGSSAKVNTSVVNQGNELVRFHSLLTGTNTIDAGTYEFNVSGLKSTAADVFTYNWNNDEHQETIQLSMVRDLYNGDYTIPSTGDRLRITLTGDTYALVVSSSIADIGGLGFTTGYSGVTPVQNPQIQRSKWYRGPDITVNPATLTDVVMYQIEPFVPVQATGNRTTTLNFPSEAQFLDTFYVPNVNEPQGSKPHIDTFKFHLWIDEVGSDQINHEVILKSDGDWLPFESYANDNTTEGIHHVLQKSAHATAVMHTFGFMKHESSTEFGAFKGYSLQTRREDLWFPLSETPPAFDGIAVNTKTVVYEDVAYAVADRYRPVKTIGDLGRYQLVRLRQDSDQSGEDFDSVEAGVAGQPASGFVTAVDDAAETFDGEIALQIASGTFTDFDTTGANVFDKLYVSDTGFITISETDYVCGWVLDGSIVIDIDLYNASTVGGGGATGDFIETDTDASVSKLTVKNDSDDLYETVVNVTNGGNTEINAVGTTNIRKIDKTTGDATDVLRINGSSGDADFLTEVKKQGVDLATVEDISFNNDTMITPDSGTVFQLRDSDKDAGYGNNGSITYFQPNESGQESVVVNNLATSKSYFIHERLNTLEGFLILHQDYVAQIYNQDLTGVNELTMLFGAKAAGRFGKANQTAPANALINWNGDYIPNTQDPQDLNPTEWIAKDGSITDQWTKTGVLTPCYSVGLLANNGTALLRRGDVTYQNNNGDKTTQFVANENSLLFVLPVKTGGGTFGDVKLFPFFMSRKTQVQTEWESYTFESSADCIGTIIRIAYDAAVEQANSDVDTVIGTEQLSSTSYGYKLFKFAEGMPYHGLISTPTGSRLVHEFPKAKTFTFTPIDSGRNYEGVNINVSNESAPVTLGEYSDIPLYTFEPNQLVARDQVGYINFPAGMTIDASQGFYFFGTVSGWAGGAQRDGTVAVYVGTNSDNAKAGGSKVGFALTSDRIIILNGNGFDDADNATASKFNQESGVANFYRFAVYVDNTGLMTYYIYNLNSEVLHTGTQQCTLNSISNNPKLWVTYDRENRNTSTVALGETHLVLNATGDAEIKWNWRF